MNYRIVLAFVALLAALGLPHESSSAQVTIMNLNHVEVPPGKPETLLRTARYVAAKEFHIKDTLEIEFPLVLVLGENSDLPEKQGTQWDAIIDETAGSLKLYMRTWDERKFAALAIRLCVQRATNSSRQVRLVSEVLKRAKEISPVPVGELKRNEVRNIGKAKKAERIFEP